MTEKNTVGLAEEARLRSEPTRCSRAELLADAARLVALAAAARDGTGEEEAERAIERIVEFVETGARGGFGPRRVIEPVSMSYFADYVLAATNAKKIRSAAVIAESSEPTRFTDFYREVREGIVGSLRKGVELPGARFCEEQEDDRRRRIYPAILSGMRRVVAREPWEGRAWEEPPIGVVRWGEAGAVPVRVNPEIGLMIGGERVALKMYLREESLTRWRAEVILELMLLAGFDGWSVAILDVRKGEVCQLKVTQPRCLGLLLRAEAISLGTMLRGL